LTVAAKDGARTVTDYPPFDIVRANFEAFAEASMGGAPYPITPDQMVHNVAVFEAIAASAASGEAVRIA
jgi:predicted dehydrogenase